MRKCNWFGFPDRKKMLDALNEGSEEFVIVENNEIIVNEMKCAQFVKDEDGKYYVGVAFVLSGGVKRAHFCSPHSLTLDEVNALLDQFESGVHMNDVCQGWVEVSDEWPIDSEIGASSKLKIGGVILIILALWVVYYVLF